MLTTAVRCVASLDVGKHRFELEPSLRGPALGTNFRPRREIDLQSRVGEHHCADVTPLEHPASVGGDPLTLALP